MPLNNRVRFIGGVSNCPRNCISRHCRSSSRQSSIGRSVTSITRQPRADRDRTLVIPAYGRLQRYCSIDARLATPLRWALAFIVFNQGLQAPRIVIGMVPIYIEHLRGEVVPMGLARQHQFLDQATLTSHYP
jgi:hypothetical protein